MMKKFKVVCFLLVMVATSALHAQEWQSSGSLRNFAVSGKTIFDEDYFNFIHRLRNQIVFRPDESSEFRLELDNQLVWGSYLETKQNQLLRNYQKDDYFDLSLEPYNNENLQWRTSVHRLSYRLSREEYDFAIGRQRIAWGTARIWNPMDLFNQVSPTAIEAGEIPGADSVHLVIRPADEVQLEVAAAIGVDSDDSKWGVKAKKSISSYDISLMAGKVREKSAYGIDFTGYLGDAGLRGEMVLFSDDQRDYIQAVMSYEYVFPNSVSLLVEYLYNGGNLKDFNLATLDFSANYSAITTTNKHYLGLRSGGQVTQLLSAVAIAVVDLEDGSAFFYPNLVYNWKQDIDLLAGFQLFFGDSGEYSRYNNAGVMMFTWYF